MPETLLWFSILCAVLGAIVARWISPRAAGVAASLAAAGCSVWSVARQSPPREFEMFEVTTINTAALVLFPLLCASALLACPKRDMTSRMVSETMTILAGVLLAYATTSTGGLLAGWTLSALPFITGRFATLENWRPRAVLATSCLLLAAAWQLPEYPYLVVAAIVLRKGIFPAQGWFDAAAGQSQLIPFSLLFASHMGALARLRSTGIDDDLLSALALVTAAYAAIRAVSENRPRHIVALTSLSQAACLLAGIESGTAMGNTGAMLHWIVVSVSATGLFLALRLAEVRFGESLSTDSFHGLGEHAPRLAVMFAVFGLALVGLPGTLGFVSEDLLVHGTLESHSILSILLPIATALNGVSIIRLFARLFLGRLRREPSGVTDLMPRERIALTALLLALVGNGIWPAPIVELQQRAFETAAKTFSVRR